MQLGWAARFDRLRVLWYRRIVNFDHADQQELVRSIKAAAEDSSRRLREWTMHWAGVFRDWVSQPWDVRRLRVVAEGAALVAGAVFIWWRFVRGWQLRWRRLRGTDIDPIRKKAGRWLRRMDSVLPTRDALGVRDSLCRLRYGRRETWPERPERVFAKARTIVRKS